MTITKLFTILDSDRSEEFGCYTIMINFIFVSSENTFQIPLPNSSSKVISKSLYRSEISFKRTYFGDATFLAHYCI